MILAPKYLLEEIRKGKIIKNLSERETTTPEGVGFDLRIATLSEISQGGGSLKTSTRRTPSTSLLVPNVNDCWLLESGKCYLATTVEEFELPSDICASFFPRSTLFRSGVSFSSSVLPPGYVGSMTFLLCNNYTESFEIQVGARFSHVVFQSVHGDVGLYKGQWQGGRISQPIDEGQV